VYFVFIAGADLMVKDSIDVQFIETSDSANVRRPTANTCACILMVPDTYENFVDFRCDFNNILTSGVWVMDYQ